MHAVRNRKKTFGMFTAIKTLKLIHVKMYLFIYVFTYLFLYFYLFIYFCLWAR